MAFRSKILLLTLSCLLVTTLLFTAIVFWQRGRLAAHMQKQIQQESCSQCERVAKDVYLMVQSQHEKIKTDVVASLNVARHVLRRHGALAFSLDRVESGRRQPDNQAKGRGVASEDDPGQSMAGQECVDGRSLARR